MENVSICMPIYNRNNFKRMILSNLTKLDYDKNKLEFCLLDDGTEYHLLYGFRRFIYVFIY